MGRKRKNRKTIKLGFVMPGQKKVIYREYILTKAMQEDLNRYGFIQPHRRLIPAKKRR